MASKTFLFLLVLVTSAGSPKSLEELDLWWTSHDSADAPEAMAQLDPDSEVAARLFDLVVCQRADRSQSYLLEKFIREGKSPDKGHLLALQAEGWENWLLAHREEILPVTVPEDLVQTARDNWDALLTRYPDERSSILALRLSAGALLVQGNQTDLERFLLDISDCFPDHAVGAYARLHLGVRSMEAERSQQGLFRFLEGLSAYPFEKEVWLAQGRRLLLLQGAPVQASLIASGTDSILRGLVVLQNALAEEESGRPEEALRLLQTKAVEDPDPSGHAELSRLVQGHIARLSIRLGKVPMEGPWGLLLAADPVRVEEGLTQLFPAGVSASEAGKLAALAQLHMDRGEIPAAKVLWESLSRGQDSASAALAHDNLVCLAWTQVSTLRELAGLAAGQGGAHRGLPPPGQETANAEFETRFQRSTEFASTEPYSPELLSLIARLYQIRQGIGNLADSPQLFLSLAHRSGPASLPRILSTSEWLSPEEAVAILASATAVRTETLTVSAKDQMLALLEREGKLHEAVAVAREWADSASGTAESDRAWLEVGRLEFEAKDYHAAEQTLTGLLEAGGLSGEEKTQVKESLAKTFFRNGKLEESRALVDQLEETGALPREEIINLQMMSAYSFMASQNYEQARQAFQAILDRNPPWPVERKVQGMLDTLERRVPVSSP